MCKKPTTSEAKAPTKAKAPAQPTKSSGGRLRTLLSVLTAVGLAAYAVPLYLQPPPGVESWLMFDGVCNLCDGFVNFVADGDSQRRVRFGAQQKHMELLERVGAPTDLSTLVLIQGASAWQLSPA